MSVPNKRESRFCVVLNEVQSMPLPTFLVVGTARAGTTALTNYLSAHPQIGMATEKEPHFFCAKCMQGMVEGPDMKPVECIDSLEAYKGLFSNLTNYYAVGETSVFYLYYHEASIKKIKQILGNPKIVMILRNPYQRAVSAYAFLSRYGQETLSFSEAINAESTRMKLKYQPMWYYRDVGLYAAQVEAFLNNFSNVHIAWFDKLEKNPRATVSEIYRFLDVDPDFTPKIINAKYNTSGMPKTKAVYQLIEKFWRTNLIQSIYKYAEKKPAVQHLRTKVLDMLLVTPRVDREAIRLLAPAYEIDIRRLEKVVNKDLTSWTEM